MSNNINEVRERLEMELSTSAGWRVVQCLGSDLRALLDDHVRLQAEAEKLERFRPLARWVSNCAGHGINSNQRRLGEELLVLIDATKAVQP